MHRVGCAIALALVACAPTIAGTVPRHVQNWQTACANAGQSCLESRNVGISASWMAKHVDWNEVGDHPSSDVTSAQLAAAGAEHIVVYSDPNIAWYCPVPQDYSAQSYDLPETGGNCRTSVARYLRPENGSYAHAFTHQIDGNRLFDRADGFYHGRPGEPLNIGDRDVQAAFAADTARNRYATDVFEDDAGGSYNCIADDNGRCSGTYGAAAYAPPGCDYRDGYWCYKYGETAYEFDRASNPQQTYADDAIALADASAHPVIGNDGVGTDVYDLQWLASRRVEGAMSEGAWTQVSNPKKWIAEADAILRYHNLHKYVVEYSSDASRLMFQIASHWIVYDSTYSIEALDEVNPAARSAGRNDATFPEESVVPSNARVATPLSNEVTVFETAPGLFVREYATCYENGEVIGYCAAIVNATGSAQPIAGLTRRYSRVLVHNTTATWAAGGTPLWSHIVPESIGPNSGLILAE